MKNSTLLNNIKIGKEHPCFIIAEIGMNHDGNLNKAKELVRAAKEAGVDAVKFQTFKATDIINPELPANYDPQEPVPDKYTYFYEYIQEFELNYEWHDELIELCRSLDLHFLSTPCSLEAVKFLAPRIPLFKIASMDLNHKQLLEAVGKTGTPVILSTGIGSMGDIERALHTLYHSGCSKIALMHCVANYPASVADLNLRNLSTLAAAFNVPVGFSDHSLGILSSCTAVALGARIIEKHFTLDRNLPGPDHYFALQPLDLKNLVKSIRDVEASLGVSHRILSQDEIPKKATYRRSIISARDLAKGTCISQKDFLIMRPGNGIDPFMDHTIVGLELQVDLPRYTPLQWDHFKKQDLS